MVGNEEKKYRGIPYWKSYMIELFLKLMPIDGNDNDDDDILEKTKSTFNYEESCAETAIQVTENILLVDCLLWWGAREPVILIYRA